MMVLIGHQRRRVSIQFSFFLLAAQQVHHRLGGALTQRHIGRQEATAVKQRQLVKGFNHDREANRRVQITFRDNKAEAFSNQAEADHQQEAQTEDDNGRVAVNEARQGLAGHQHQADGDDHRGHHHRQVVDHADGSDHRVERKDGVEHHDLRHHGPEFRPSALGGIIAVLPLQPFVEFDCSFKQQE